jgi:hypothetical protein
MTKVGAFIISAVLIVFSVPSFAAEKAHRRRPAAAGKAKRPAPKKSGERGVQAQVKTEGAIVYNRPDFDADQLVALHEGQKIVVSKGTFGSYAKFYKVKVGNRIGYIADIDVEPSGSSDGRGEHQSSHSTAESKRRSKKDDLDRDRPPKHMPIYFTRYLGVYLVFADFKEDIVGVDAQENLLMYGLKITGPGTILNGPSTDFNLALHYGAPSYYGALSSTKPSGFVLWTDLLFLLPLVNGEDFMAYVGVGPLMVLSNIKATNSRRPMDLTAVNVGASFSGGLAFRINRVAIRVEGKYMWEKVAYKSVGASLQMDY